MKQLSVIVSLSLLALACSPAAPTNTATPTPAASASAPVTPAATDGQVKLGHFTTADGMNGFVLDRTGAKPKIQVDGSKDIVELTVQEDRPNGELRGYRMIAPDGAEHAYLSVGGGLRWNKGKDSFPVTKDKDTAPLGEATVKGEYTKPKPEYEPFVAEMKALSVMVKLPGYKPEDASQLAKVGEAIQKADASMFVHYTARGETSFLPALKPTPSNVSGIGYGGSEFATDEEFSKKHKKLAEHGARLRGLHQPHSQGNHIKTFQDKETRLPEGTPGLIWEVDDTTAVFVSLDGGRYEVPLHDLKKGPTLVKGAGPEAKWPAPAQDSYADISMISAMAKVGAAPQKVVDELTALDDEWNKCAQKTWQGADKKIDSGKMTVADYKDWAKKVQQACGKSIDKMETTLVAYIEGRAKERKELFEKSKARVVSQGANK